MGRSSSAEGSGRALALAFGCADWVHTRWRCGVGALCVSAGAHAHAGQAGAGAGSGAGVGTTTAATGGTTSTGAGGGAAATRAASAAAFARSTWARRSISCCACWARAVSITRWRAARSSAERPSFGVAGRCPWGGAGRGGSNTRRSALDGAARLPPPAPCGRERLVSTTTVLVRPWLKLCFTVPELTDPPARGFRVRGWRPPGGALRSLLFSSLIRSLYSPTRRSRPFT